MTNGDKQGAPELTEQDRVELRQLAELILGTKVNDRLFEDLLLLSGPILEALEIDEESAIEPSPGPGWHSFATFQAASTVLEDLLLPADRDPLDELEDQKLTAAADRYGVEDFPLSEEEIEEISSILRERLDLDTPAISDQEWIREAIGETVPDFLRDARSFGWLDPAAVEGAVEFFGAEGAQELSDEEEEEIQALIVDEAFERMTAELDEARILEAARIAEAENDHREVVGGDLSDTDAILDEHDEGHWGLAEIDSKSPLGDEESDEDGFEDGHQDHGHSNHIHQILGAEIRGLGDYDAQPATAEETTMLALIAEGALYAELSDILLADILEEAGPLFSQGRLRGTDWWMSEEAAWAVTDLLARMLTGDSWPRNPEGGMDRSELRRFQKLAASYPLDPIDNRKEKLLGASQKERLKLLRYERGERRAEALTESELAAVEGVIREKFREKPNRLLVRDIAGLLSDDSLDQGRSWGWDRALSREIRRLVIELLLGIETAGWNYLTQDQSRELSAAIRVYRSDELTEDEFLAHYDQSRWPSIGAAVDLGIFTILDGELQVLLIERGNHPEKGKWALPGGFVNTDEDLEQAAARELQEETAVDLSAGGYLEQVKSYGSPSRDRRGYMISILYTALLPEVPAVLAGDDAAGARFIPVERALSGELPLAFDHEVLISDALERVRAKLEYSPIVFDFLPEGGFTLPELRRVYEIVWGFEILPSDFTRRLSQAQGALAWSDESRDGAALWRRGPAETFFPPLDRRQVLRGVEVGED